MASEAALNLVIGVTDKASGPLKSLAGSLGTLGKIGAGAVLGGAVAGVGALSAALVTGIGDARDAAKVFAQTQAVIKSTGGAAGFTADQIADMAGSLSAASGKSLFGDDDIQRGQNMLLTFTNISKTLPDATQTMLDLAQATGGDMQGAALQLGKALNSPKDGVSALTRVGVTFTEEQKKMITTLQDSGDMAGAQTVILQELQKEFGGSAAAAAAADGGFAQFKDQMGELAESVGAKVLPVLNSLMGWLTSPSVQTGIQSIVDSLISGVATIGTAISAVVSAFQTGGLAGVWDLILPKLQEFGTNVLAWIGEQAPLWGAQLLLWGQQFVAWVGPYIPPLLEKLGELATSAWGWVSEQAPILLEKLGGWGVQLAAWILPQIPVVLENLGRVIGNIVIWIGEQLPAIDASTKQWGESLYKWIETVAIPGLGPAFTKFDAEMGRLMDNLMKLSGDAGEETGKEIAKRIDDAMHEGLPHFRDVTLNEWSEAIFTWLNETAPKIIPGAKALGQTIIDAVKEKQAEWLPTLNQWADDIFTWANETADKVLGWVKEVGTNMILGMVNGVTEQAAKLGAAAVKAVLGAIASAKAALGIKSPSRLTRDEIGMPIVEGIITGINNLMPKLSNTLVDGLHNLADQARSAATTVGDVLTGGFFDTSPISHSVPDDLQARLDGIADGAENLADRLRLPVNSIQSRLDALAGSAGSLADEIPGLTSNIQQAVDALADNNPGGFFGDQFNEALNLTKPAMITTMTETLKAVHDQAITPWGAKVNNGMLIEGHWMMGALAEGISNSHDAIDAASAMGSAIAAALIAAYGNPVLPSPTIGGAASPAGGTSDGGRYTTPTGGTPLRYTPSSDYTARSVTIGDIHIHNPRNAEDVEIGLRRALAGAGISL